MSTARAGQPNERYAGESSIQRYNRTWGASSRLLSLRRFTMACLAVLEAIGGRARSRRDPIPASDDLQIGDGPHVVPDLSSKMNPFIAMNSDRGSGPLRRR